MSKKAKRTDHSGGVDRLPSGRWRARYTDPVTNRQRSAGTFATKSEADDKLAEVRTDQRRGAWIDPDAGNVTLADFATAWLDHRTNLAARTREMYHSILDVHIVPALGDVPLGALSRSAIEAWHRQIASGASPSMAPKAYRLLRQILATAVDDEVLLKNPARIKSAGQERATERTIASIEEVLAIAETIDARFRAMVLVAALGGLRLGEVTALRRGHVDLDAGTVTIGEQRVRLDSGETVTQGPKTDAGRRQVHLPTIVVEALREHLEEYTGDEAEDLIFTGRRGNPVERTSFRTRHWLPALKSTGICKPLTFHDLRHTAATEAARTGATTKDLMARLGYSTMQAAIRYQHAAAERDKIVASGLDAAISAARNRSSKVVDLDSRRASGDH